MAEVFGFKIIRQYEQGIVFRFGRAQSGIRQPGLIWVNPFTSRLVKVNMQIAVVSVPAQETITRDNVTLKVDAVVYYRVVDPLKAIINVQNYQLAVSQVAQTSLRAVTGRSNMDQLLSEREHVNAELKDVIDAPTEGPWGIRVERVEVKDISLPESMKRSMSRQAEAERERRARIIAADGEYQASKKLAQAAGVMAADPAALQLRLLQTVVEVAAEKNSTLVMPFPVELLRFFDRTSLPATLAPPPAEAEESTALPPPPAALPAASQPAEHGRGHPPEWLPSRRFHQLTPARPGIPVTTWPSPAARTCPSGSRRCSPRSACPPAGDGGGRVVRGPPEGPDDGVRGRTRRLDRGDPLGPAEPVPHIASRAAGYGDNVTALCGLARVLDAQAAAAARAPC